MRDKESRGQFHLISELPWMYIIQEGILWLSGWCETSWLKLDRPFFMVCWFFLSSLCEDRAGFCGATSSNSWSGTCTFCTSWYLKTHQPFWIGPSLFTNSSFLCPLIFTVYVTVHGLRLAEQVTTSITHVHTKVDTFKRLILNVFGLLTHTNTGFFITGKKKTRNCPFLCCKYNPFRKMFTSSGLHACYANNKEHFQKSLWWKQCKALRLQTPNKRDLGSHFLLLWHFNLGDELSENNQKNLCGHKKLQHRNIKKCIQIACGLTPSYMAVLVQATACARHRPLLVHGSQTCSLSLGSSLMQYMQLQSVEIHMPRYAGTICHTQPKHTRAQTYEGPALFHSSSRWTFLYNWKSCLCQTEAA